jgi:phospholipid-binding lipoprotein MlaA
VKTFRGLRWALLSLACAATLAPAQEAGLSSTAQNADPWESFNRSMFAVNEVLDSDLIFPITSAYVGLVPELVRIGVSNVFANAQDLWSAVNHLLQGKLENSTVMTMRFVTNSVFGVAGILDIATAVGMERKPEDFGQTLGVWGVPAGNYLVLPFFGPSTVRDATGLPLDIIASPAYAINQGGFRPVTTVLQVVNTRSKLLGASQALDEMALDKYTFVREAFLSRRLNMVFDGNPPDALEFNPPAKPAGPGAPAAPVMPVTPVAPAEPASPASSPAKPAKPD